MDTSDKEQQGLPEKQPTINKRRRNIAKAGVATPLIMSLMNKTALGQGVYHCSISGAQSGNTSSPHDTTTPCNVGYSVNNWQVNADQTSGNGNINDWLAAGVVPFDIQLAGGQKQVKQNGIWVTNIAVYDAINSSGLGTTATTFSGIFGSGTGTLWEALSSGGVGADAAADYLNAAIHSVDNRFSPVYDTITPGDIVNLYQLYNGDISSFTTSSGVVIDNTFNVANYLTTIKN